LAERLALAGLEVSGVRLIGVPAPEGLRVKSEDAGPVWDRDKILVAQVVSVEKHPNADKLKLPTVDYGQGRTKKMVTGAPNLNVGDAGQKGILALAGSGLYDGVVVGRGAVLAAGVILTGTSRLVDLVNKLAPATEHI